MAKDLQWQEDTRSVETMSTAERYSDEYWALDGFSERTISTAHTDYSTPGPTLHQHDTCFGLMERRESTGHDDRRASVETYASTEPSDVEDEDELAFELMDFPQDEYRSDAIPATPRDFAELFPSARRLSISHDDSTLDGQVVVSTNYRTRS
jgi:hypothetical protein